MPKRKYQEVWEKIKDSDEKKCSVQVHKAIVARTVKAVVKEKYNDAAFKLANPNDRLKLEVEKTLLVDKKHYRITFKLVAAYGLADITKEIEL